jgi:outer membrane protein OmpA-like peptidoglycan-associated protein
MEPVRCTTEDLVIEGRYIVADGNAVEAADNCDVEISGSCIKAGGVAVLAEGNSDVEIDDTHVEGGQAALVAAGNADILISNSRIVGGTVVRGNADINDEGGNEMTGVASTGTLSRETRGGAAHYTAADIPRLLEELGATIEAGRVKLEMAGDVLFDFDSTQIRPDAAVELAKVAHVIRERAEGTVRVSGHTDSAGDATYNQDLSERRARAVAAWLLRAGIPAATLKAEGLGETKPVADNTLPDGSDNPAGRATNRRVEISFAARESPSAGAPVGRSDNPGTPEAGSRASAELSDACAQICRAWPSLNDLTTTCVTVALDSRGYEVIGNLGCIDVESASDCLLCWRALRVTAEDCTAILRACLRR